MTMRWFNTSGPCTPRRHFMLSVQQRLPGIWATLARRQSWDVGGEGKTTALAELAELLNKGGQPAGLDGEFLAVHVSVEAASSFVAVGDAELAVLGDWWAAAQAAAPLVDWPMLTTRTCAPAGARISVALHAWAVSTPKQLVLLVDDLHLLGHLRNSFFAQLHEAQPRARRGRFPIFGLARPSGAAGDRKDLDLGHRFELPSFTEFDLQQLLNEYALEHTSPHFTGPALTATFRLTQGHPRAVNGLLASLTTCSEIKRVEIDADLVHAAWRHSLFGYT